MPVTKTALPQGEDDEIFSTDRHKWHMLFSGTQVLQTMMFGREPVKAVVVHTGKYHCITGK